MLEAQLAELMAAAGDGDDDDDDDDDETAPPRDDERAPGDASEDSLDDEGGEAHGRVWRREHNLSDSKLEVARRARAVAAPTRGGARAGWRRAPAGNRAASLSASRAPPAAGRRESPRRRRSPRRPTPRPRPRGHGRREQRGRSVLPAAIAPPPRRGDPGNLAGELQFMKRIAGGALTSVCADPTDAAPAGYAFSLEGAGARRGRVRGPPARNPRRLYWGAADIGAREHLLARTTRRTGRPCAKKKKKNATAAQQHFCTYDAGEVQAGARSEPRAGRPPPPSLLTSPSRAQRHWHDLTQKKVEVLAAGGGGAALGDATPPVPPSMSGRGGAKIYHSVRSSHRRKLAQSPYIRRAIWAREPRRTRHFPPVRSRLVPPECRARL